MHERRERVGVGDGTPIKRAMARMLRTNVQSPCERNLHWYVQACFVR